MLSWEMDHEKDRVFSHGPVLFTSVFPACLILVAFSTVKCILISIVVSGPWNQSLRECQEESQRSLEDDSSA